MFHDKSLTLINLIPMQNEKPKFKAIADHALLITFSDAFSEEVHSQVIALDNSINLDPPLGLIETVPAIVNLLVTFDPLLTNHSYIKKKSGREPREKLHSQIHHMSQELRCQSLIL